jgi:DNA-binding response OmpR family regulator
MRRESDPRVLIVEDEWLIAAEVERELNEAGFATVGPVPSIERALAAIERGSIDAAILDIRLQSEDSYPVANALTARRIPFLFMTGYSAEELSAPYCGHACLTKPFSSQGLIEAVAGMLAREPAAVSLS